MPLLRRARLVARHLGLDIHRYHPALEVGARRTRFLREHRVGALIDGGANTGQWALAIRGNGYRGLIVSFEPLADPFAALRGTSAGDPLWHCVQAALGDADTEARMNVAGNSVSSSLQPMEPAHAGAAPESAYVGTEAVRVLPPGGKLLMTTPNPAYWRFHFTGRSVLGGAHLSQHRSAELAARLRRHGFCDVSVYGSGRWSRHLGEHFPCRVAYGSYMITARTR